MKNSVGWFEIYVQDMARAQKFYEAVFQTTLQKLPETDIDIRAFPMVKGGMGAAGALVKMEGVPSHSGGTLIYFYTEDCAVEAARAVEHGGKIFKPKFSIGPYGFIAHIIDTEGNMIGLHSMA